MKYQEWKLEHEIYLKTDKWKLIRSQVLERDCETCQKCGNPGWQIHHLTYIRWRNERLEDLITLCDECHRLEHLAKKAEKRKEKVKNKQKEKSNPVKYYIDKILKAKEFVRMDKEARKLLYPHPMEILEHFEFRGKTYQEKFDDITQKWFRKEDLAQKLKTMDSVFAKYRAQKNK